MYMPYHDMLSNEKSNVTLSLNDDKAAISSFVKPFHCVRLHCVFHDGNGQFRQTSY